MHVIVALQTSRLWDRRITQPTPRTMGIREHRLRGDYPSRSRVTQGTQVFLSKLVVFVQKRRELYIRLPLPQNIKLKSCENKITDVCRQQNAK